jgi:D-sedoheptulose 7-phosphate isomerase
MENTMNETNNIRRIFEESIRLKQRILDDSELLEKIEKISYEIISAFKNDKKVLICGNGGSAADAQHISSELSGKFYLDREPLFSEALHVNTSYLTAVSNDYSFEEIYSRLVKAKGRKGDILIGISTSGKSKNIIKAVETANQIGMISVCMTGESGGLLKDKCNYLLNVPSSDTPRIQEAHILIGHTICEIVEKELFGK